MTTSAPGEHRENLSATGDALVTEIGAKLRATKLDELPQLLNVLIGDMSLVGPRPEVPEFVALWDEQRRDIILSMRPGITDPASIEFSDEGDLLAAQTNPRQYYIDVLLPRKTARYVDYVMTSTFATDMCILRDTLRSVVRLWRRD